MNFFISSVFIFGIFTGILLMSFLRQRPVNKINSGKGGAGGSAYMRTEKGSVFIPGKPADGMSGGAGGSILSSTDPATGRTIYFDGDGYIIEVYK